ncbi:MAG: hypothetical protein HY866_22555 [Chloroflexi bacterium]|nr:hypothetical protein [Chloroflexota bacterium]
MMNRSRPVFIALLALLLIGGLALTACGEDKKSDVPPSIVITVRAEPVATLLPGCKTEEMVAWYEVASTLIFTFKNESQAALELSAVEVPPIIGRLTELRDAVGSQPAPECASMAHNAIMLYMRQILEAYQSFTNGDISKDEQTMAVNAAINEIDNTIGPLLSGTQASLEQRLREERATQEASGGS